MTSGDFFDKFRATGIFISCCTRWKESHEVSVGLDIPPHAYDTMGLLSRTDICLIEGLTNGTKVYSVAMDIL
jgi:hypothetical protein